LQSLRKEACWSLSNITAGTPLQVAAVIACDIIPPVVNLLQVRDGCSSSSISSSSRGVHHPTLLPQVDDFEVQKEAAWYPLTSAPRSTGIKSPFP